LAALLLSAASLPAAWAQATACPVKVGGILPLTGSMAPITKKIAQAAELAFEHVNQGGGVKGSPVQFILLDDQGQPSVGVDAAKYLVEVERVQAFTGTISSGVTGPIISAVTAPSKVVQISCCSSASNFTDGRSGGYFFRTLPTSKTQAYATASEVNRRGMKRLAIIYVNTDFGTDMLRFYRGAHNKLGGDIVAEVAYNDNQPSYRAEVSRALAAKPYEILHPHRGRGPSGNLEQVQARPVRQLRRQLLHHAAGSAAARPGASGTGGCLRGRQRRPQTDRQAPAQSPIDRSLQPQAQHLHHGPPRQRGLQLSGRQYAPLHGL
jgi:ABC-type branched-subunit amino acid transport system substrate-binding protein